MKSSIPVMRDLRPNPDWAKLPLFDRKDWRRVRFGDVVQNVNQTERIPAEAGIERFIGLEHLEPGSLHVRAWGDVANGTTFTRRCRPGQVLFGKRRAYQRKVAVAEFDAVVSGDIYVFAPKDERLLPELLPFLCMSERFFQHAVGTSAGSLSPRTNWSSLAGFEFDLPPLDRQRRIAEMLWAVDEVRVAYNEAAEICGDTINARLVDFFDNRGNRMLPQFNTKNKNTHIIVERIVADIDDIVKKVRFPDWQHTSQGERLVQKELRKALLKYKLHTDQDLFDRAYAYIRQYYYYGVNPS